MPLNTKLRVTIFISFYILLLLIYFLLLQSSYRKERKHCSFTHEKSVKQKNKKK